MTSLLIPIVDAGDFRVQLPRGTVKKNVRNTDGTPCFGQLNAPLNYTTYLTETTKPSTSLDLFNTTLEVIGGFHQSCTGTCRQKPGPIQPSQRKVIPKRIVIDVGQAKSSVGCAVSPMGCSVRRSISPFPPKQYLLFAVAVAMGEVAKGEYLQCRETGGPESPVDQPDEFLKLRGLSRWLEDESGGIGLLGSPGTWPGPLFQILLQRGNDLPPNAVVDSFLPTESQVKDLDRRTYW